MPANPVSDLLDPKVVELKTAEPNKTDVTKLRRMVDEFRDLTADPRKESLTDVQYYHNKQWLPSEIAKLNERNQPALSINRIAPAVDGIIGVVEKGRSDPRALPRTPDDEDSAEVATDTLRYISDKNHFARLKIECFSDMLIPGYMAAIVAANGDLDITVTQISWRELIFDPRSRKPDFSDARFMGIAKWMYADDLIADYKAKADDINGAVETSGTIVDASMQDLPQAATAGRGGSNSWGDRRTRRLFVVEMYYREAGKWLRCVFTGQVILEEGPSPFLDDKGRPMCPIEAQAAKVDSDNARYGPVRAMRDPQDEVNKRRSTALHLLMVRQVQARDGMALDTDAEVARNEAAKPDGALPMGWEVAPLSTSLQGHLELLQEAKSEIERMGPNPAVLGRQGADSSGRALLARQQAGMVELALLFGRLEDWELRVYRQMWARAKQYWRAPQFVRVTDDQDAPKFVGINQPIHEMEPALHPDTGQPQLEPVPHPDTGKPQVDQATGHPVMAPKMQPKLYGQADPETGAPVVDPTTGAPKLAPKVLGYSNPIAEMDVDIILDTTPDMGTLQQEQFTELAQLLASNPAWAATMPMDLMLEISSIPRKRQIIEKVKAAREEAAQAQQAQVERAQKIAEATAIANVAATQAGAAKDASAADLNKAKAEAIPAQTAIDAADTHTAHAVDGFKAGMASAQPVGPDTGQGAA